MLYLLNRKQVTSIYVDVVVCNSFFSRLRGAMLAGEINRDRAYWFPGNRTLHSFLMNGPMSLLYYGEDGRVLSYRPSVGPGEIHPPPDGSRGVLELASNRLKPRYFVDEETRVGLSPALCQPADQDHLAHAPGKRRELQPSSGIIDQ